MQNRYSYRLVTTIEQYGVWRARPEGEEFLGTVSSIRVRRVGPRHWEAHTPAGLRVNDGFPTRRDATEALRVVFDG